MEAAGELQRGTRHPLCPATTVDVTVVAARWCQQASAAARKVVLSMKVNTMVMNKLTSAARRAQQRVRAKLQNRLAQIRSRKRSGSADAPPSGDEEEGDDNAELGVFRTSAASQLTKQSQALICQRICHKVFWLLRHMFYRYSPTARAVVRHVNGLIKQVGFNLRVEPMLRDLFKTDESVLEVGPALRAHADTIRVGTITHEMRCVQMLDLESLRAILDLVRVNGRRDEYLDLVTAACSHRESGVSSKQELVADLIFGDGDGVFSAEEETTAFEHGDATQEAATIAGMAASHGAQAPSLAFATTDEFVKLETSPGLASIDVLLPTRNSPDGCGVMVFCAPLPHFNDFARQRGVDAHGKVLPEARRKRSTRLYGRAMTLQQLRSEYLVYTRTHVRRAPRTSWKDVVELLSDDSDELPKELAIEGVPAHRQPSPIARYGIVLVGGLLAVRWPTVSACTGISSRCSACFLRCAQAETTRASGWCATCSGAIPCSSV